MLNNKKDRLNYGNILMPPMGYELNYAVATTYSLDLETLTATAIALGVSEDTDSIATETPVALLHSLHKITDKIVIFCEAGQIKKPRNNSKLLLLLEKMTIPVSLEKQNDSYPSFHPKTWTLEYINSKGEKLYRFIVLSRNLTFDRSWDVVFTIDGVIKKEDNNNNNKDNYQEKVTAPLASFLNYLLGHTKEKTTQHEIVRELKDNIKNITFELSRNEFSEFSIIPIGIGNNSVQITKDDLFLNYPNANNRKNTFQELTIMSPFVSEETIKYLNDISNKKYSKRILFTRRTELPKIKDVADKFDIYVLNDTIIDGEEALQEAEEPQLQDIHAKIYQKRKHSENHLYIGSMNASHSGLCHNVEIMVKLKIKQQHIKQQKLCEDFFGGKEDDIHNPFIKVDLTTLPEYPTDDTQQEDIKKLKKLCRTGASAKAEKSDNGYTLTINFELQSIPENVKISPLRINNPQPIAQTIKFENLNITDLSEFYVVTIVGIDNTIERIIKIPTSGIPEERNSYIVKSVIKNEKFLEYISIALGEDILSLLDSEYKENSKNNNSNKNLQKIKLPALYERMLKIAHKEKERLQEIEHIMSMIDESCFTSEEFKRIYNDFTKTYNVFKSAVK